MCVCKVNNKFQKLEKILILIILEGLARSYFLLVAISNFLYESGSFSVGRADIMYVRNSKDKSSRD